MLDIFVFTIACINHEAIQQVQQIKAMQQIQLREKTGDRRITNLFKLCLDLFRGMSKLFPHCSVQPTIHIITSGVCLSLTGRKYKSQSKHLPSCSYKNHDFLKQVSNLFLCINRSYYPLHPTFIRKSIPPIIISYSRSVVLIPQT